MRFKKTKQALTWTLNSQNRHALVSPAKIFGRTRSLVRFQILIIVIPYQEAEKTHVSKCPLPLYSQLAGFELHFLNFRQVASNTMQIFLQVLVILPWMLLKFCRCFMEQTSSVVFQCVACDTVHLTQEHNLMRSPSLLCLMFESTHSFPHFRSRHFGSLCNCNMNFITSCLLVFLSCSFEACLVEVPSVSALVLPVNVWLCQHIPITESVLEKDSSVDTISW